MIKTLSRLNVKTFLSRFARERHGAAIVEFALIVPVLLGVLAAVDDLSAVTMKEKAMRSSVSSAAQYVMRGGSDLSVARQIVLSSWTPETEDATVSAVKSCYCGSVAATCSNVCTDASIPQAYVRVSIVQPYDGWYTDTSIVAQQEVRVRWGGVSGATHRARRRWNSPWSHRC
ncbi:hypothetical protein ABI_46220 [Asticcacaulis biprosthecium C19]|uniref:TadE-like domain-containing protein n=1 Tax=Asticcacaulis biprosthecium C19 TaxID=715226 RepID=F4QTX4_9CAUL|nr:TadE/TadG family type IV pilus assembly protein [Asticcacaulis biprosthecium]EGF89274.1 hypothetical protein ABI_46220 [Asticcacaulis biprosthecium C19]